MQPLEQAELRREIVFREQAARDSRDRHEITIVARELEQLRDRGARQ